MATILSQTEKWSLMTGGCFVQVSYTEILCMEVIKYDLVQV